MTDDSLLPDDLANTWVTGTGQLITNVHSPTLCEGRGCPVHHPSDHRMKGWPTNFREGGMFDIKPPHTERVCEHGIGHPDPDDIVFWANQGEDISIHGCDGCCFPEVVET